MNVRSGTTSSLKERWRVGELQLGLFTRLTAPEVYKTLVLADIDFIIIDTEHGSFGRESLSRCTRWRA